MTTLEEARTAITGCTCWVLTDGKAGDLAQCLGVAERLGLEAQERVVKPRAPWLWLMPLSWRMPFLAIDPAEAPGCAGSSLQPPYPDLVIASGRRAAPYLPAIKRASGGKTFTAFLKDPRTGPGIADFLWVPAHDRLRGENVLTTLTSPHRITPEALATLREAPPAPIAALKAPRVAVLIGGNSKDFTFTDGDVRRFWDALGALASSGASIMATASRRTPPELLEAARTRIESAGGWFWDGTGENPYRALLANAESLVVTAESVNMVGEALATGKPVHLFRPGGGSRKIDQFLRGLEEKGVLRPFSGALERYSYAPMDATPEIAITLARRLMTFRNGRL
ncbi:MAG: nucleoside-diphosphate sugar epimerase [Rhizobiales bacterium PAR1]|nr:MAG: nucleoside-diphosphate sugar epimerase [Rhizobiales bacterium PAR1]